MSRPATSHELEVFRSDGQASRLFAILDNPQAVFICQVNQTFTTHDKLVEVAYDNAAGDLADVLPDMTILVGSTPGAYDLGFARVRKAPLAGHLYIGECSEIAWAEDLHLTILDDFGLWPKHLRVSKNGTAYMDWEVPYSDQHTACDPLPALGPDRVLKLQGASVSVLLDGSGSWCPGSSISAFSWTVVRGLATLVNANTATPTLTATAAGRILLACTVTAANGKSSTGYRVVHVYDQNHLPGEVVLSSALQGDLQRGGFEFTLEIPDTLLARQISIGRSWDAEADFSATQGLNDWRYQYWDGATFIDMENWDGSTLWISNTGVAVISAQALHPGSGSESAARTWTAPDDMEIVLRGNVVDANPGGGDGVIARILHNEIEIWSATLDNGGSASHKNNLVVSAGDTLRFVVEKRGEYSYDTTAWAPIIEEIVTTLVPPRDQNRVILFAEERPESIGPVPGAENVLAVGWLDAAETILDAEPGQASITVKGPHHWLGRITGFPAGIENVAGTPTAWTQMNGVTVDKVIWHLLAWRSTAARCIDLQLSGDTRLASALEAPTGSLWQQIMILAGESILAVPMCDPLGRFFLQVDANLLPEAERSSIPVILTLTRDDYESVEVEILPTSEVSRVELSGVAVSSNEEGAALFSLAPGHVFKRHGQPIQKDRLLLASQSQANALAGLILGNENRRYSFIIRLMANNRLVSLVPHQYLQLEIDAAQDPLGLGYNGRIVPRSMSLSHDPESGAITVELSADPEVFEGLNTDGDIPVTNEDGSGDISWEPPKWPPFPPPPELPPPYEPPSGEPPSRAWLATTQGLFYTEDFDSLAPTWVGQNSIFWRPVNVLWADMNVNGQIWALVQNDLSYAVFYGDFAGPMWLHTPESFFKGYDSIGGYALIGMDGLSDKLMVGYGHGYPGGATRMFAASRTTAMDPGIYLAPYAEGGGNITIAGGKALLTYPTGVLFAAQITRLADDAKSQEYTAPAGGAPGGFYHFRAGRAADLIIAREQTNTVAYTDGGEAGSILPMPLDGALGAADPTGQYIITNSGVSLHLSSDGGTSYSTQGSGNFPFAKNPYSCRVHCIDASRWVLASAYIVTDTLPGSRVFFTPDFGASWVDKTGNLNDLVPNFAPLAIRTL